MPPPPSAVCPSRELRSADPADVGALVRLESQRSATIGEIYGAFDDDSHRVFREAMRNSRGGAVRVSDLAFALGELAPVEGSEFQSWPCMRRGDRATEAEPAVVPMTNEPALRDLLQRAYRIAAVQPRTSAVRITPRILWGALFAQVPCTGIERIFDALQLVFPEVLRPRAAHVPARSVPQPAPGRREVLTVARPVSPTAAVPSPIDLRPMIQDVLQEWLDVQDVTDSAEAQLRLSALQERVRLVEDGC